MILKHMDFFQKALAYCRYTKVEKIKMNPMAEEELKRFFWMSSINLLINN